MVRIYGSKMWVGKWKFTPKSPKLTQNNQNEALRKCHRHKLKDITALSCTSCLQWDIENFGIVFKFNALNYCCYISGDSMELYTKLIYAKNKITPNAWTSNAWDALVIVTDLCIPSETKVSDFQDEVLRYKDITSCQITMNHLRTQQTANSRCTNAENLSKTVYNLLSHEQNTSYLFMVTNFDLHMPKKASTSRVRHQLAEKYFLNI